jgi:precorrin-2 dehydrogenase/sirohydrochlorin ferrochelatase
VLLELGGRSCLVVGGGPVAARRAQGLSRAGARVTVVAPRTAPAIDADPALEVVHRPYRRGEVTGYHLVMTATGDPDVDGAVVEDAIAEGIWVSSADQATPGTVHLPAVHREGPVTVAVSTGGASPAMARWLRDRLVTALPREVAVIAGLLEEARRRLQEAGRETEEVEWATVLDDQVVPLVGAGRIDEARAVLARL